MERVRLGRLLLVSTRLGLVVGLTNGRATVFLPPLGRGGEGHVLFMLWCHAFLSIMLSIE